MGQPHGLSPASEFATDVQQGRNQHDHERVEEEPAGVGDGRITTVGEGDQDVDEEGTAHCGMKHHGGDDLAEQVLGGCVHTEQARQGRQEEHEQGHAGEDQGHHRGAGFAAEAAAGRAGGGGQGGPDEDHHQAGAQRHADRRCQSAAVVVGPTEAGQGVERGGVPVVPAAHETEGARENQPREAETGPRAATAAGAVIKQIDCSSGGLDEQETAQGLQWLAHAANAVLDVVRDEKKSADHHADGDEHGFHASHLLHSDSTSPMTVDTMAVAPTMRPMR